MGRPNFQKFFQRALPLYVCEYWREGETKSLPELLKGKVFFEPLFVHKKGRAVEVYYDIEDRKQDPELIASYFNEKPGMFEKMTVGFDKYREQIGELVKGDDLETIFKLRQVLVKIWPLNLVAYHLGGGLKDLVDPKLAEAAFKFRTANEQVHYEAGLRIYDLIEKHLPEELREYAEYVTIDELVSDRVPNIEELKEREKYYVYWQGRLLTGAQADKFLEENFNLLPREGVQDNSDGVVKGQVAYRGKINGPVRILFDYTDVDKVNKGDILVSPMTTPDFMPLMKMVAAFVTDEGGMTCHAAISAREMKKPCIVGTGNATDVFHDGDIVEVDAEKGIVRKI